jgi:hypothetical protein
MDPFDMTFDFVGEGYGQLEGCSSSSSMGGAPIVEPAAYSADVSSPPSLRMARHLNCIPSLGGVAVVYISHVVEVDEVPTVYSGSKLPGYSFAMALCDECTPAMKVMEYAASRMLTAVVECPFPFTTDAVRKAFRLQESRHAHGKIVIRVLAEDAR